MNSDSTLYVVSFFVKTAWPWWCNVVINYTSSSSMYYVPATM